MTEENQERFVDGESNSYGNEQTKFEQIVLMQMQKCAEILSREVIIGYMKRSDSVNSKTQNQTWVEDTNSVIINSVDVFRMFMNPFLDDDVLKEIEKINSDIKTRYESIGSRKILVKGIGEMTFDKVTGVNAEHPYMREYLNYKAQKYRNMFELLVKAYHKKKAVISSFSYE